MVTYTPKHTPTTPRGNTDLIDTQAFPVIRDSYKWRSIKAVGRAVIRHHVTIAEETLVTAGVLALIACVIASLVIAVLVS